MKSKRANYVIIFLALAILPIILSSCASQPPVRPSGFNAVTTGAYATTTSPIVSPFMQTAIHEVGPMETLWRIAKEYNVDIKLLMQVNGISNPNQIEVGQKLKIPGTAGFRPVIPLYRNRPWSYIVIHHTATEMGNAISINRAHHQRGFWDGLGYHFLVDNGTLGKLDGQIEISPRWIKQKDGAHCNAAGMNQNGIGIALVGNFSQSPVSSRQLDSLTFLVTTLMKHYRIPLRNVIAHRDVPGKNTECPGTRFPWKEFISRLRKAGF